MEGLVLTKGNESRIFTPNGSVVVMDGGQAKVRGQWRCGDAARPNRLSYNFDGVAATAGPLRWSFNDVNQLVAVIPAAANEGADSAAFTFPGRIRVDDNKDLVYEVYDAAGKPTGVSITVFGDLKFADGDGALEVHVAGGGAPARITGDIGVGSLSTSMHSLSDFKGSDVLKFQATTFNTVNGDLVPAEAEIKWVGTWDLKGNKLVFAAETTNDAGGRSTAIVLGGKTEAVAGGLVYLAGPDGSRELALEVSGSHRWNGGDAKWDVSLGYSNKKLSATVAGEFSMTRPGGQKFTLKGKVAFTEDGRDTTLDMNLEASYHWGPGGMLQFNAAVSMQNGVLNYDLRLEGQFDYNGTQLTFAVQFTRDGSGNKLVIKLAARGDSNFMFQLMLVMNTNDPSKVNVSLAFKFQVKWIEGVPVKEKVA
jgi:hypothetical protein